MQEALQTLPSDQRAVIALHMNEASQKSIAESTSSKPEAVNSALYRAKRKLRAAKTLQQHREQ